MDVGDMGEMNLYVYRVDERTYGAGIGRKGCESRGVIVETWPMNTLEQAAFVSSHGTAYAGASEAVSKLAELIYLLMKADPTFEPTTIITQVIEIPAPQPRSWLSRLLNRKLA
jgi:hypothetical protein